MKLLWPLYPTCLGPEEGAHLAGGLLPPPAPPLSEQKGWGSQLGTGSHCDSLNSGPPPSPQAASLDGNCWPELGF